MVNIYVLWLQFPRSADHLRIRTQENSGRWKCWNNLKYDCLVTIDLARLASNYVNELLCRIVGVNSQAAQQPIVAMQLCCDLGGPRMMDRGAAGDLGKVSVGRERWTLGFCCVLRFPRGTEIWLEVLNFCTAEQVNTPQHTHRQSGGKKNTLSTHSISVLALELCVFDSYIYVAPSSPVVTQHCEMNLNSLRC